MAGDYFKGFIKCLLLSFTVGCYLDVHVLHSLASFVFDSPWRILAITCILFLNEVRVIMRLFNQDPLI